MGKKFLDKSENDLVEKDVEGFDEGNFFKG